MDPRRTSHTEAELTAIFKEQELDERFYTRFLGYYKICFEELSESYKDYTEEDFTADGDDDSIQKSALSVTTMYTVPFSKLIDNGHSEEWAHLVAHEYHDELYPIRYAYSDLENTEPEKAKLELQTYCKSINADEYFTKYFLENFQYGEEDIEKSATLYSSAVKETLAKGKSAVYAHQYARLYALESYHKIYIEEYAYAYDKAISEGKNEEYAKEFATKYGETLVDNKRRDDISDDQELIDFKIEEVNGYMKAWKYANENKLANSKKFIETYTNIHLNTYFADQGMPEGSIEEVDKAILNKALARSPNDIPY